MTFNKAKSFIWKNRIYYLAGFVIVFGLKYFYSKAGSNELKWILTPTAWWVRILSGIAFEYEPHVGYVSHDARFIIASSCSGVQFMIISMATLIYSYVHRMRTMGKGFCWISLSIGASYLLTIFVNGFRIVFSIYLPLYLSRTDGYRGWITPEKLHTITGIVVYFTSLFAIYHIAGYISHNIACKQEENPEPVDCMDLKHPGQSFTEMLGSYLPPVFWYFSIALGIPFLNRAYKNDGGRFMEYAALMTAVCLTILCLFCLITIIRKHIGRRKNHNRMTSKL